MALISCAVTAQLICAFVFANAKVRFSHDLAEIRDDLAYSRGVLQLLQPLLSTKPICNHICKYLHSTEPIDSHIISVYSQYNWYHLPLLLC